MPFRPFLRPRLLPRSLVGRVFAVSTLTLLLSMGTGLGLFYRYQFLQHIEETQDTAMTLVEVATQTVEDFASADLLRTVVESCPTKLLLANPALDRRTYAELFQLNEMELDLLTGLVPRQHVLLKRPDLAKVLTLTVDPRSYWIYTNTPIDNARVAATFREYGFEAGLDRLAASA